MKRAILNLKMNIKKSVKHIVDSKIFILICLFLFISSVTFGCILPTNIQNKSWNEINNIINKQRNLPLMLSIFFNNTRVCLYSLTGIISFIVLINNGIVIGIFLSHNSVNISTIQRILYILPHGILEISIFIISSAIGIKFLYELIFLQKTKCFIKNIYSLIFIIIPIIFISAIIETIWIYIR